MQQKRISILLIVAGALAALGIVALAAAYAPALAGEIRAENPQIPMIAEMYRFGLAGVWASSLIVLYALGEYFRVSVRIGKGRAFCPENVKSLSRMAICLWVDGGLWLAAIFAPGLLFHFSIGPAWLLFLLVAMANFALGLLAWCLGWLLDRAVSLKQENDLTV